MPSALASPLTAFYAALTAAVVAAWPEVQSVETEDQADRINWNNAIDSGDYIPPFAIIEKSRPLTIDEGPVDCKTYQVTPKIFYIADENVTATENLEDHLQDVMQLLVTAVDSMNYTCFDTDLELDTSEGNPVNVSLLQSDAPFLAGSMTATFWVIG